MKTRLILMGLVMASFPFGQFVGSPLLGRLSDRYGRKRVILYSLGGAGLGYLLTAYSVHLHSMIGMFAGLAVCGFCEGNVTIAQSVVADLTQKQESPEEKASCFGWINIFVSLGFIIGPLMGGQLADSTVVSWFTFSTPFWMAACLTVVGMLVIYFYSKETLEKTHDRPWHFFQDMRHLFKSPSLRRFYWANFFLALGTFSFFRFFPVFLEKIFSFTPSQLSYVMVYDSLAIGAGVVWLIPFLSRKLPTKTSLVLFSFLFALTSILCLLPSSPYALIWTLPPLGICLAVIITKGALLISDEVSIRFQGAAMGLLTSVQVLAEMLTGLMGGSLAAYHIALPLYIGSLMALACSLLLLRK
jgi:MFS family permease